MGLIKLSGQGRGWAAEAAHFLPTLKEAPEESSFPHEGLSSSSDSKAWKRMGPESGLRHRSTALRKPFGGVRSCWMGRARATPSSCFESKPLQGPKAWSGPQAANFCSVPCLAHSRRLSHIFSTGFPTSRHAWFSLLGTQQKPRGRHALHEVTAYTG